MLQVRDLGGLHRTPVEKHCILQEGFLPTFSVERVQELGEKAPGRHNVESIVLDVGLGNLSLGRRESFAGCRVIHLHHLEIVLVPGDRPRHWGTLL